VADQAQARLLGLDDAPERLKEISAETRGGARPKAEVVCYEDWVLRMHPGWAFLSRLGDKFRGG
jgi:hypothetical protein